MSSHTSSEMDVLLRAFCRKSPKQFLKLLFFCLLACTSDPCNGTSTASVTHVIWAFRPVAFELCSLWLAKDAGSFHLQLGLLHIHLAYPPSIACHQVMCLQSQYASLKGTHAESIAAAA